MWARVIPTMSSLPEATACRAVATSAIFAAWNTGTPVSARTSPAKSRCGALAIPCTGITRDSSASVAIRPRIRFRKSTCPEAATRRAISTPSSRLTPLSNCSSATIRSPTMNSGPTASRTASSTAHMNRNRLSSVPPQSSSRRF